MKQPYINALNALIVILVAFNILLSYSGAERSLALTLTIVNLALIIVTLLIKRAFLDGNSALSTALADPLAVQAFILKRSRSGLFDRLYVKNEMDEVTLIAIGREHVARVQAVFDQRVGSNAYRFIHRSTEAK